LEAGEEKCKEWISGNQDKSFLFSNYMRYNAVTDDVGLLHGHNSTKLIKSANRLIFARTSIPNPPSLLTLIGWKLSVGTSCTSFSACLAVRSSYRCPET
jgi:hypothetical protein